MTKYEEMCRAANAQRLAFDDFRERSWRALSAVVDGLKSFFVIPENMIVLGRWNGQYEEQRNYFLPDDGGSYGIVGAARFDPADEFWYLGLQVSLNQLQFVRFSVAAGEKDGKTVFKLGPNSTPEIVDPLNDSQMETFCERITDRIIQVYREPKAEPLKPCVFATGTAPIA
jgi:hypothetical protein